MLTTFTLWKRNKMKTVKYKGQSFQVPEWAKFIAADACGAIYAYRTIPDKSFNKKQWVTTYISWYAYVGELGENRDKAYKLKEIK